MAYVNVVFNYNGDFFIIDVSILVNYDFQNIEVYDAVDLALHITAPAIYIIVQRTWQMSNILSNQDYNLKDFYFAVEMDLGMDDSRLYNRFVVEVVQVFDYR